MRSPAEILRDTPWAALSTAYASGTVVPEHLEALLSGDPEACSAGVAFLESSLLHQQTIYPATAPALEFAAAVLDDPRTSVRCESALTLADEPQPLRADLLEWIALVAETLGHAADRAPGAAEQACLRLLPDVYPTLLPHLEDRDPATRRGALRALTYVVALPPLAEQRTGAAALVETAARSAPPDLRAATADAIAAWGLRPAAFLRDDHPGVRGHAAMAATLDDDPAALAEVRAALRDPLTADHWWGPPLPWGDPMKTRLAAALARRTVTFDEVATEAAALARVADRYSESHELLELLGRHAGPIDRPTPALRRVLAAAVDNDELWPGGRPGTALRAAGVDRSRDEVRALLATGSS
jgi:hypothetical protein